MWFASSLALADNAGFNPANIGPNCDLSQGGQQEMNACSGVRYQAADKEMNKLYQQLMQRLSKPSQEKLRASQRAWLKYRDAAYAYEIEWNGPCEGTICPLWENQTLTELTNQRIERLRSYVSCTDNGCPE